MKILHNFHDYIRIMIVEDEIMSLKNLEHIVNSKEFQIVGTAKTISEAEVIVEDCKPDLIISDICLGKRNIFEIINNKNFLNIPKVFITGHADNGNIRKCKTHSSSVLLTKPFNKYTLLSSIKVLLNTCSLKAKKYLLLSHRECKSIQIDLEQIINIEADGNYIYIHLTNGSYHTYKYTLKKIGGYLPESFVQVNKSNIVNLNYVKVDHLTHEFLSLDGRRFKIGRSFRSKVLHEY
ncbi:LytR/AlgR family response regulator transcription factor [Flectobacillus roseus]|uniref:LytR/AlgR family response regulator transcription factor n=1 Tax=Flectobacillus roseus TaxID=502259 RepID=UPI0024B70ED4|nr:LytTR family DNA-binding domain-containing protein [Flectobacillus roseus]MDI9872621.1 LytTR family DNA-binding domain-containing protein [Flectobacillus roseus]